MVATHGDDRHRGHGKGPAAVSADGEEHGKCEGGNAENCGQDRREYVLVVPVDCDRDRPGQEGSACECRSERERARGAGGSLTQIARRADREVRGSVEGEEEHDRDTRRARCSR